MKKSKKYASEFVDEINKILEKYEHHLSSSLLNEILLTRSISYCYYSNNSNEDLAIDTIQNAIYEAFEGIEEANEELKKHTSPNCKIKYTYSSGIPKPFKSKKKMTNKYIQDAVNEGRE